MAATAPFKRMSIISNATASSSSAAAPSSFSSAALAGDFAFPGVEGSGTSRARPEGFVDPLAAARKRSIEQLIFELTDVDKREHAIAQLSMKRQDFPDLAPMLWFSFGTVAILMKEIIFVYPLLSPSALTLAQTKRVCNVLALLQCVASHPDTRGVFIQACIPFYLYSFLKNTSETKLFEYLRVASLGVISALVKVPDTPVILFLLSSEIMPLCLSAMERGSGLSKIAATFIMQRIMLDDVGLEYVCSIQERLFAVNKALTSVVSALVEKPSPRLLKHVIRCYLRLTENERSLWVLRYSLPSRLTDGTFHPYLWEDQTARSWLQQLLLNVLRTPVV